MRSLKGQKDAITDDNEDARWELRPGGMLVQIRNPDHAAALDGSLIKVKVSYGLSVLEVPVHAYATFGDLKKVLVQDTGLQPQQQCILYKGKERGSSVYLNEAGVKDKSKIVLVEDVISYEKRLMELRKNEATAKACRVVVDVKQEVDMLARKVTAIESAVVSEKTLAENEFTGLIDSLMFQLLKLDRLKAEGDAELQRRILVRRIQRHVETLDALKTRNDSQKSVNNSMVSTAWESLDTCFGNYVAPSPSRGTAALVVDWEQL